MDTDMNTYLDIDTSRDTHAHLDTHTQTHVHTGSANTIIRLINTSTEERS